MEPTVKQHREPIAIVGSGCRFPGNANTTKKLWQMLKDPPDLLKTIPNSRFNTDSFYHPDGSRQGCTNTKQAYLLSEPVDRFDAAFFNINPREAEAIDPQQRMLLEVVYEAMEAGGFTVEDMRGSDTAVYVGSMTGDYAEIVQHDPDNMPQYMATGTASSIISNRVSYFFDWTGPSETINTACSSSLVAVNHAVQTLRDQESKMAVAGGTNLILSPYMFISESKLRMLSPTGRSRMWDDQADGYARGEGFAAILMKRLSDALADGDHIECIIRETAVNQDGRTKGITMPSSASQTALIRKTYERAGLDWRKVEDRCQYFEAHGTGTQAGDVVEARGVAEAFFDDDANPHKDEPPLYVGSIKTVVGHLEGSAGMAGLLKASLALQNAAIPPNLHFQRLNPAIVPYYDHLEVPTNLLKWPAVSGNTRRASVNSFGFGGTNAHVILESAPEDLSIIRSPILSPAPPLTTPIVLSAMSKYSLTDNIRAMRDFLQHTLSFDLENLAWSLQARRSHFSFRAVFSGISKESIVAQMTSMVQQYEQKQTDIPVGTRMRSNATPYRTLAVFTGQGAQWATMGRDLLLHSEVFSQTIDSLDNSLQKLPDPPQWSIRDELLKNEGTSRLGEAEIAQPLCTALQIALLDVAAVAGIRPDAAIGHSSGEIAAAYAAGALSARDAVRIAYYRGVHTKLARGASGQKGAMMAVGVSFEEAESFCSQMKFQGRISVAAVNSPSSVTLAGDEDAVAEAKSALDKEGTFARILKVDKAYHSSHMTSCTKPYIDSLLTCGIQPRRFSGTSCAWYSSVHRRVMHDDDLELLRADYWADNMTSPVFFAQALEKLLQGPTHIDVALEFGPHSALKGPVLQTMKDTLGNAIPYEGILHRGTNDVEAFSKALGFLWLHVGLSAENIDRYRRTFRSLRDRTLAFVPVPGYCWDHRQSFWSESRLSKNYRNKPHPRQALLGRLSKESTAFDMRWRNILRLEELPWLRGHQVQGQPIFPAAGYLVMALEAAKQMMHGKNPVAQIELLDVSLVASIDLDEDTRGGREIQFTLKRALEASRHKSTDSVVADFACYSCIDQNSDAWETNIYGKMRVTLDGQITSEMPKRDAEFHSLASINVSNFYEAMDEIGLNYSGLFRGLTSIQRKMGFSTAVATLADSDAHSSDMLLHPSLLDSCFQVLFAAYAWPGDGSIRNPFVPTGIQRISISSPFVHSTANYPENNDVAVDAYITASSLTTVRANLNVTPAGSDEISVQVEGLVATCLVPAGPQDDREVFSETVWEADISSGVALLDESPTDSAEDLQQIEVCERLAYYYLRRLKTEILPQEIVASKWHHQRLFEFIEDLFAQVDRGEHATLKRDWARDTKEELSAMKSPFESCVDVQLTTAVGENLPRIIRGEIPALEVMLDNNMLDRIYKYGIGFPRGNRIVSRVAQQITHRHANMNILEIGAGTGGATSILLRTIGHSFSSYTFSDISAGFFENAQIAFKEYAGKMKFKTLDIEGDMAAQGFSDHSFDAIIASNVLHATKNLKQTLHNVRRLLKPGGYLMLLEVTSEILRIKLMMSGLPGWWLGGDDDRRFAPTVSAERWDGLLRATGFSGVDTIVHDMNDTSRHMTSVMVSQAVNDQFSFLRNPTMKQENVVLGNSLIIGGATTSSIDLVHAVSKMLRRPGFRVLPCLEEIVSVDLTPYDSVLCLAELDQPVFSSMTGETLSAMQKLFEQIRHVLWITSGCRADNPYANMSVGLGRSLHFEFPQLQLQFLDIGMQDLRAESAGQFIVESFLRFVVGLQHDTTAESMVWTNETELVLENGILWIPRIMANKELNDRLNARRRVVKRERSLAQGPIELSWVDGQANLQALESTPRSFSTTASHAKIQVRHSLPYALRVHHRAALFLCEGAVVDTGDNSTWPLSVGQRVIALSSQNASTIETPVDLIFQCSSSADDGPYLLHACAMNLMAAQLDVENMNCVLIHNPDPLGALSIQSLLKSRGVETVLTATDPIVAKDHGWIYVPPRCADQELALALPSNLDAIWDQSPETYFEETAARIRAVLPEDSLSYSWTDFYRPASHVEPRLSVIPIAHLFAFACRNLLHLNTPSNGTPIDILPAKNIWTTQPTRSSRCVINWDGQAELSVRIQPVQAKGLFRLDRTYFLVGCTGGLGLSLCRWMVENGARYMVVTSRDPTKVDSKWTQEIRTMGAEIKLVSLDISDKSALYRAYEEVRRSFPPVAGIANAAMVLEDRMFSSMSHEDLTKVLRPKVDGTKHLDELFGNQKLDFFVLFSSAASVVGNRGQSNYAAANLFMVSLANHRRKRGLAASVIDIGMVLGVGYITENGIFESKLKRHNLMPISEPEFHNMFVEAIVAGKPGSGRSIQLTTGLHRASRSRDGSQPFWAGNPRFSHFFMEDSFDTLDTNSGQEVFVPVRQLLQNATTQDQHVWILQDCFLEKLGRILQVPASTIEQNEPLVNLGVDSLMAVEVRTWFLKEVDIDVPVLKVLGGSCVIDLCTYASEELYDSHTPDEQSIQSSKDVVSPGEDGGSEAIQAISSGQESMHKGGSSPSRFSDGLASSSEHSRTALTSEEDSCTPAETTLSSILSPLLDTIPQTSPWARTGRMSYAQRRLWFLIQYTEDPTTHNVTMGYRITGALRIDDLQEAFRSVIQRHESLRTCFFADEDASQPMQGVLYNGYFNIEIQHGKNIEAAIETLRTHHYDLAHGETLKAVLLKTSPDESYLILGFSHLILDGLSAQILIQEVQKSYTLPHKFFSTPPQQYMDFALRQYQLVENGDMEADILFWKSEFFQPPPVLPLFSFARVKTRKALRRYDTHSAQFQLDADCVGRIAHLSKMAQSTSFSFYLTALQVLLFKLLGRKDVCIGISDANRSEKESLGVIGFFVNLLPVSLHCDTIDAFDDAIQRTAGQLQEVLAHSRLPFDVLLDSLGVTRTATESPMFQVLLDYQKGPAPQLLLRDSRAELHFMQDARNGIDLTWEIKELPGRGAVTTLRSQKYLYDQHSLRLLLSSYCHILETASKMPQISLQQLAPFPRSDKDQALKLCNSLQSSPVIRNETASDMIFRIFQDFPKEIALRDGVEKSLTYAELGHLVGILAEKLIQHAVQPGHYAAVFCESSFDCICSILAIHSIGAVYIPLDTRSPRHRIEAILGECSPAILIHDQTFPWRQIFESYSGPTLNLSTIESSLDSPTTVPRPVSQPDSLAYVIYTSGSTGTPKGVLVTHANLVCQLHAMRSACHLGRETVLQQSSLGFDASIDQIFNALAFGGTLVLVPPSKHGDAAEIAKIMAQNDVTMTQMTPSEYTALLAYGSDWLWKCRSWKFAFCGGEAFTTHLWEQFRKLSLRSLSVYNRYGPTEITVSCCLAPVSLSPDNDASLNSKMVPCGLPLENYSTYILDEDLEPVPIGYPGEICIGGGGVARGYLQAPDMTETKFVQNPFASHAFRCVGWDRLYRTGDQGLLLEDGSLVCLGRVDGGAQVKINGRRIELGEISSVVVQASNSVLADAAVSLRKSAAGTDVLFAIVAFMSNKVPEDVEKYCKALSKRLELPDYMRPTRWAAVDSLPRNTSGKLDWDAVNKIPIPARFQEPNETLSNAEGRLAVVWAEVLLDDEPLAGSSDFFEMGGNSSLLLRLRSILRERYGEAPGLADLFANSTLSSMAAMVLKTGGVDAEDNIDWEHEAALPELTQLKTDQVEGIKQSDLDVVLTGATGFLGSEILRLCVRSSIVGRIHCIAIRNEAAIEQLRQISDKVMPYRGDLRQLDLGLDPVVSSRFMQHADLIIHNAADVSFLKSYHSLQGSNVHATRTLLRMAILRRIPFHFVSTGGVANLVPQERLSETSIAAFPPSSQTTGYIASKWVSECMAERASYEFGIPVHIHRPASITGPGAPVTDIMQNIMHYSEKIGAVPQLEGNSALAQIFDFVTVGFVAEGIVTSALQVSAAPLFTVRHHCSDVKRSFNDIKAMLEKKNGGTELAMLDASAWTRQALAAGMTDLVASMIESVLQKQGQAFAHVLVKGS